MKVFFPTDLSLEGRRVGAKACILGVLTQPFSRQQSAVRSGERLAAWGMNRAPLVLGPPKEASTRLRVMGAGFRLVRGTG
jgi:hypothetical protein